MNIKKRKFRWFQTSVVAITALFLTALIGSVIIAYSRRSGFTNLDPIQIQKTRLQASSNNP